MTTDGTATIAASAALIKNGDTNVTANYTINYTAGTLIINAKAIDDVTADGKLKITINPTSKPYNGADQKPTITVKDDTTPLTEGTDYTVTYKVGTDVVTETKDAHVYDVVIASKAGGNYSFSSTKTFEITPIEITITASDQTVTYGTPIAQTTDKVTISPARLRRVLPSSRTVTPT